MDSEAKPSVKWECCVRVFLSSDAPCIQLLLFETDEVLASVLKPKPMQPISGYIQLLLFENDEILAKVLKPKSMQPIRDYIL